MNLERVDAARREELNLPVGSILLNQMEYIIEVLMKFEPSLQLKVRTAPGNQESFATRPTTSDPTEAEYVEYMTSLHALLPNEIVEIDAVEKKNTKLHYNSEQNLINLPAIVGCLNWIALRTRPDIVWATSRAASLITHDPDICFIRVKHICDNNLSISTLLIGLCVAICSNTSTVQTQIVGTGRCLLCTDRGEESTGTCCLSWYHLESKNRW